VSDALFAPSEYQFLKLKPTGIAGVWIVGLPALPWRQSKAEEERNSLVHRLVGRFPTAALWVSDWVSEVREGWHFPGEKDSLSKLLADLQEGGWGLVLFGTGLPDSLPDLKCLPSDPRDAVALLRSIGAGAAIFSWEDDREWMVAVREYEQTQASPE
jgi:hypothetical protein